MRLALILWIVGIKVMRNYWTALTLPLVLLSSYGYVGWHIARTADTDSALAFWILLQCVLLFGYTTTDLPKKANRYLLLAGLAFSFGCLTKGIAGLTALPGMMAWLIYTRKFKETFQKKEFYIGLLSFIVLVIGYYWLRNKLTPGYFDAVWEFEIGGRLGRQEFLNQKTLPFYFYFDYMITQDRFFGWIFVLPLSIIYILTRPADRLKHTALFFIFIFVGISILLGLSRTKLEWYDAPLYSLMAAIIGISFCMLFKHKGNKFALLFICIFSWPYYKIMIANQDFEGTPLRDFLQQIRHSGHEKDSIHIINSDPNFTIHFYSKKDCVDGYYSDVVTAYEKPFTVGSYVLTEKEARDYEVNQAYVLQPVLYYKHCVYYRVLGKK